MQKNCRMKKILYLLLVLLPVLGWAQSRYGVEGVPVCWRTPLGVDSSLNRYVIISSTGKPVQTIVYENAAGGVVTVSGGSMRYGYCDCIDFTVPDSSVTWEMLTEPVKDSIRFTKIDTFITVPPSQNYFQNTIDNPAKFYNNIYFSCKGRTDTSIVVFLANPVFEEQKGVVYHIKNDSGLVAAFVINYNHLSNSKRFYLLKRGQTAQVRLLPDAANGGNYGWAVNVVWDSLGSVSNIFNENGYVPNNVNRTLWLDSEQENYMKFNNSTTGKNVIFNFVHDPNFNYSPYVDMNLGYDKSPIYHGNANFSVSGGIFTGGPQLRFSDRIYASSFGSRSVFTFRRLTYGSGDLKHLVIGGIVDSIGSKNSFGGISISWDSINTSSSAKKAHFTGFSRGTEDLQIYKNKGNKSWLVQTLYDDNPFMKNFDWIRVKNLDGDSTANNVELYGKYPFANDRPSVIAGAISNHIWKAGIPSFLRSQHKTISGTTDGSGDITITFDAAMPDATYTVIVTGQGTTPYVYMTQSATLATGSVKVRMFTLAGSVATSTAYQISYEVKDTN